MASTKIEEAKGGSDFITKSTISCWVKRSSLGVQQDIWSWGENNSYDAYLRFDTADNIETQCDNAGATFNTTSLYRDVNGWFHFVFSLDGSNSTANLRRRFWINGVQIDEGKGSLAAFSSAIIGWHSTQDFWIGARARSQQSGATEYFDGLMSHFHYCCNNSYSASDFGETDATTGEWKIKVNPNVQYGTHGFFLKMEDSSNMDLDSSGNGHVLTTSGTLTATKDCPSNVFATMNPLDNHYASSDFHNGNTKINTNSANYTFNNSTLGYSSGKYYWETKLTGTSNYDHIGITSKGSTGTTQYMYASDYNYTLKSDNGVLKYKAGGSTTDVSGWSGASFGVGNIISIAHDVDNNKIYFAKDGVWMNSANPNTPTGGITTTSLSSTDTGVWLPAFGDENNGTYATWEANFGNGHFGTTAVASAGTNASGNGIFEYDVPTGYTALSTKGLNL